MLIHALLDCTAGSSRDREMPCGNACEAAAAASRQILRTVENRDRSPMTWQSSMVLIVMLNVLISRILNPTRCPQYESTRKGCKGNTTPPMSHCPYFITIQQHHPTTRMGKPGQSVRSCAKQCISQDCCHDKELERHAHLQLVLCEVIGEPIKRFA